MVFDIYSRVPKHKSKMPSNKALEGKEISPRTVIVYILIAVAIVFIVYYVPDYFFLERITADHTALFLNLLGVKARSKAVGNVAYLNEIRIVKDCTGVQVLAVFLGMLIPLPNASFKKKLLTIVILSTILYIANLIRISLEFWLVYFDVLPWVMAHYPLSLLLGVLGVFILVLVTDRLLPEFRDFIFYVTQRRRCE